MKSYGNRYGGGNWNGPRGGNWNENRYGAGRGRGMTAPAWMNQQPQGFGNLQNSGLQRSSRAASCKK